MLNLSLSGWNSGGAAQSLDDTDENGNVGRMWLVAPERTLHVRSLEGQSRSIRCVLDAVFVVAVDVESAPKARRRKHDSAPGRTDAGEQEWCEFGADEIVELLLVVRFWEAEGEYLDDELERERCEHGARGGGCLASLD